jgi:hypothetical protein
MCYRCKNYFDLFFASGLPRFFPGAHGFDPLAFDAARLAALFDSPPRLPIVARYCLMVVIARLSCTLDFLATIWPRAIQQPTLL